MKILTPQTPPLHMNVDNVELIIQFISSFVNLYFSSYIACSTRFNVLAMQNLLLSLQKRLLNLIAIKYLE